MKKAETITGFECDKTNPVLRFEDVSEKVRAYRGEGKSIFASSSFQTHSIPLLHMLARIDAAIPIVFINTGFLFPETLTFRDQIAKRLNLNLVEVKSTVPKIQQLNSKGSFFFTSDPDRCCHINKVEPLEPMLIRHDVWISGIRADQTYHRQSMAIEQKTRQSCLRFHPLLGWSAKMIYEYRMKHDLPEHPLEKHGYLSVGCEPCTRRLELQDLRNGRWFGSNKSECGLHTNVSISEETS